VIGEANRPMADVIKDIFNILIQRGVVVHVTQRLVRLQRLTYNQSTMNAGRYDFVVFVQYC